MRHIRSGREDPRVTMCKAEPSTEETVDLVVMGSLPKGEDVGVCEECLRIWKYATAGVTDNMTLDAPGPEGDRFLSDFDPDPAREFSEPRVLHGCGVGGFAVRD